MAKHRGKENVAHKESSDQASVVRKRHIDGQPASEAVEGDLFWKDAIEQLQERRFGSLEEALHAIIDQVLSAMKVPEMTQEETRNFLFDMLSLDEEIVEEIRATLQISK